MHCINLFKIKGMPPSLRVGLVDIPLSRIRLMNKWFYGLLALMSVLTESLLALVCGHLVTLFLLTVWHNAK